MQQTRTQLDEPTEEPTLQEEFARARDELLLAHKDLAELATQAAQDPYLEFRAGPELAALRARRDALLDRWARIGLSWLQRGGKIELIVTGAAIAGAVREPAPPPARVAALPRPPAPRPPSPPADLSQIDNEELGPTWSRATQTRPREFDAERLAVVLRPLAPIPEDLDSQDAVRAELFRLAEAVTAEQTEQWQEFPRELQRALIGHVVARARHLQDELPEGLFSDALLPTLDRIFSSMTGFSKREQPGFVFGLMRSHTPVRESWLADARAWWKELDAHLPESVALNPERALAELERRIEQDAGEDEIVAQALAALDAGVQAQDPRLVRQMLPHLDMLRKHARFKRLRKAIRDAQADDEAFELEMASEPASIAADWPHWPQVRGRRAAIVGGDLRVEARERIAAAFGFEVVDWVTTDHVRHVQGLASAVEGGTVDLVIVLRRFIGHDVDRVVLPVCRTAGVPWVSVERGYGINQIKLAVERFLGNVAADT